MRGEEDGAGKWEIFFGSSGRGLAEYICTQYYRGRKDRRVANHAVFLDQIFTIILLPGK